MPKRIVTLDPFFSLQTSLWLGLDVVGSARSGGLLPASVAGLPVPVDEITHIGQVEAPDLEMILELSPDLIIGDAYAHGPLRALLSRIAPTALVRATDWQSYLKTVARAVGREEDVSQGLADYENRASSIRSRMPEGLQVSFVRLTAGGFQVYVAGPAAYAPAAVMTDAGVVRPDYEHVTDETVLKRPGWEGLLALSGDVLLYVIGGGHHDVEGGRSLEDEVTANPIWQSLPAVKAGRAYRVDAAHWMGFGGLHSAEAVLDDIERLIIDDDTSG
ncbi:MAG: iron-siderophore ABC transporter substrate-binding protein [Pseudomonadota bacterium]